jgi:hypothetical protein
MEKAKAVPAVVFVKAYTHYRTGKTMVAKDYGYTSWRFLTKKK